MHVMFQTEDRKYSAGKYPFDSGGKGHSASRVDNKAWVELSQMISLKF